jgi:hypothetical protein
MRPAALSGKIELDVYAYYWHSSTETANR